MSPPRYGPWSPPNETTESITGAGTTCRPTPESDSTLGAILTSTFTNKASTAAGVSGSQKSVDLSIKVAGVISNTESSVPV